MQSLLGAIVSSLGFGSANVVIKKALEDVSIPKTLFMSFVSGAVCLFIYALVSSSLDFSLIGPVYWPLGLAVGEIILYVCLYKAFAVANVAVATALVNLYPILTTIGSVLFLKAVIGIEDWFFILLMIFGAALVSVDWQSVLKSGFSKDELTKGLGWIGLTILAQGIYFPSLGVYTADGGLIVKLLAVKVLASIVYFIVAFVYTKESPVASKQKILPLSLLGLLEVVGWVGFSFATAVDLSKVGLVTAALNLASIITAILAFFVLKEKLRLLQYVGIVVIVLALILQSL